MNINGALSFTTRNEAHRTQLNDITSKAAYIQCKVACMLLHEQGKNFPLYMHNFNAVCKGCAYNEVIIPQTLSWL